MIYLLDCHLITGKGSELCIQWLWMAEIENQPVLINRSNGPRGRKFSSADASGTHCGIQSVTSIFSA